MRSLRELTEALFGGPRIDLFGLLDERIDHVALLFVLRRFSHDLVRPAAPIAKQHVRFRGFAPRRQCVDHGDV